MKQQSTDRDSIALRLIAEGNYSVTSEGKVFSENYGGKRGMRKELISRDDRYGYLRVYFSFEDKRIEYAVHRLVLLVYLGIDMDRRLCNHINGIKHDNRIENLEWVTPAKNLSHAFKSGLMRQVKGETHPRAILKEEQVVEILELLHAKNSRKEIAQNFGISINVL